MTYEEIDEQAFKVFNLAYKHISLNGDVTGETKRQQDKTITSLKNAIIYQQKEISSLKTRLETTTEAMQTLDRYYKATKPLVEMQTQFLIQASKIIADLNISDKDKRQLQVFINYLEKQTSK